MFLLTGRVHNHCPECSRTVVSFVILLIWLTALIMPVSAIKNPSAVYCTSLGYQYTDVTGSNGGMTGYCILPGNQSVDAWQFFEGKAAQEQSYCRKEGYGLETVNDRSFCRKFLTSSCSACIFPNGTKTEMTELMNLNLGETLCLGDKCCGPEDTNCSFDTESPDMLASLPVIGAIIVMIVLGGLVLFIRKKKQAGRQ